MPVVQSLMDNLVKRYGPEKGKRVYYAMEAEGKGPFGPKGKHRDKHEAFAARNGVTPAPASKKKAPGGKAHRGPERRVRNRRR